MSSYQALYRKWRPMRFDDVVGQRQVSDTLKTAIKNDRIAHAYLFCGTRGTGKTSTAKIFSRAVNCESPIDGEPCNECPTCKGILNGSIPDVYEMDAASNRGVDNIRDIRDEVIYTPVGCGKKIYIIDEVHMLTEEAFNALLKTIEEPPPHAIFILATTEPQRIPQTVLSRCQRFDFRRITVDDIASRLTKISAAEGIDITPDAVELVAELGDGSMRDAISLLDRCSAFGGEQLTCAKVSDIVGIVSSDKLFEIADCIADGNSGGALTAASEILRTGKEPQNLLESMSEHFRALLLCKASDNPAALLEKTETAAAKYADQAQRFSTERILFSIKALGESLSQAKWLSNPKIAVETAVVKLSTPSYSTDVDALLARIEKLETAVANLSSGIPASTVKASPAPEAKPSAAEPEQGSATPATPPWDIEEAPPAAAEAAQAEAAEQPRPSEVSHSEQGWDFWAEALNEIKKESRLLYAFLYNAAPTLCGDTVEIEVDGEVAYGKIATPGGIEYLSKLFSRVSGSTLGAKVYIKGQREAAADSGQPSIHDLAKKKELFGDAMEID
ncbi:MAG: DNA polymerase III subunit gamma/tau [Monoglobaceae bacterium]